MATTEGFNKHWTIILAFKEGKELQYKSKQTGEWYDITDPSFCVDVEYRIKPREWVVGALISVAGKSDGFTRRLLGVCTVNGKQYWIAGASASSVNSDIPSIFIRADNHKSTGGITYELKE